MHNEKVCTENEVPFLSYAVFCATVNLCFHCLFRKMREKCIFYIFARSVLIKKFLSAFACSSLLIQHGIPRNGGTLYSTNEVCRFRPVH